MLAKRCYSRRLKTKDAVVATLLVCCMTMVTLLCYVIELGDRTLNIVIIQDESDGYAPRPLALATEELHLGPNEWEYSVGDQLIPLSLYAYDDQAFFAAAYSDFRNETPQVRAIAFCYKDFHRKLYCKYEQKSYRAYGRFVNYSNRTLAHWRAAYFVCDIPTLDTTSSIVLGDENDDLNDVTLPVHVSVSIPSKQFLGVCVKGGYGSPDPIRLIEWMELNELLGVDHVIIYNASLTGNVSKVFNHYVKEGRLTVVSDNIRQDLVKLDPRFQPLLDTFDATTSTGNEVHPQTQLLSLQDCISRFRARFEYILIIDIDELLVPSIAPTLPEMITMLRNAHPSSTAFSFLAAQYLDDFGPTNYTDARLAHTLAYTQHSNLSYEQVKTLHSTTDTVVVNWHRRVLPVGNFTAVGSSYGWLHHYRAKSKCRSQNCSIDNFIDDGGARMGRYAADLVTNMRAVLEALNFVAE